MALMDRLIIPDGVAKVIELLSLTGELKPSLPAPDRFVDLQYLKAAGLE